MAIPVYAITELAHRYGDRTVLEIRELAVDAGETLGIVGPSGAGKSTLLRLLQFLEPPTAGRIAFHDEAVVAPAALKVRRRITTVFQHPLLLDCSVRENVGYGLRLRGKPSNGPRVGQLLERLGLASLARSAARYAVGRGDSAGRPRARPRRRARGVAAG